MQTIQPIHIENASEEVKRLLDSARAEFGLTPNMLTSLAQSPAALDAYLRFRSALSRGRLEKKFREQLALAVAQENGCRYSLAAHTALVARLGATGDEILESRDGRSADTKTDTGLQFVRDIVLRSGDCSPEDLLRMRQSGYTDEEIVEIVANVALAIYENYFNLLADTDLDFPEIALSLKAA